MFGVLFVAYTFTVYRQHTSHLMQKATTYKERIYMFWPHETCQWLLCNKIIFIHSSTFIDVFEKNYIDLLLLVFSGNDRGHVIPPPSSSPLFFFLFVLFFTSCGKDM